MPKGDSGKTIATWIIIAVILSFMFSVIAKAFQQALNGTTYALSTFANIALNASVKEVQIAPNATIYVANASLPGQTLPKIGNWLNNALIFISTLLGNPIYLAAVIGVTLIVLAVIEARGGA